VMKALEKDPARRYQTANDLARDIQRHLADEPIEARPPTLLDRVARWSRRHRAGLAVTLGSTFAALVAGSLLFWHGQQKEARERRRAEKNLSLAMQAVDQMYLQFVDEEFGELFRPAIRSPQKEHLSREREGVLRRARSFYAQFAEANRDDPSVEYERAGVLARLALIRSLLGRHAEALQDCDEAIRIAASLAERYPQQPEYREGLAAAHLSRGSVNLRRGDFNSVIDDCTAAIQFSPASSMYRLRAVAFGCLGQLDRAMADCDRALALDPKNAVALCDRGNVFLGKKDPAKAMADYDQAILLDPKQAGAYYNRGTARAQQREYDKAMGDFDRAIELDATLDWAWHNRASVRVARGQLAKAIEEYSEALRLGTNYPTFHARGFARWLSGDFAPAMKDFEQAYQHRPRQPGTYTETMVVATVCDDLAWVLASCPDAKLRDPARALQVAEEGLKLGGFGRFNPTVGVAHYYAGDYKAALAALDKSGKDHRDFKAAIAAKGKSAKGPPDLMANFNTGMAAVGKPAAGLPGYLDAGHEFYLAMTHWQLGDRQRAREHYDRGVQWLKEHPAEVFDHRRLQADAARLLGIQEGAGPAPAGSTADWRMKVPMPDPVLFPWSAWCDAMW